MDLPESFNQICDFLKGPITLQSEESYYLGDPITIDQSLVSSTSSAEKCCWTPTFVPHAPSQPIKPRKDWVEIPQTYPFFINVHPKGSPKTFSLWILISPDYIEVFSPKICEVEVLPIDTKVFVDSKNLYICQSEENDAVMQLLSDRELLNPIIHKKLSNQLHIFLQCFLAAHKSAPPLHAVSAKFYFDCIYTLDFLKGLVHLDSFSNFPDFVVAQLPFFDDICKYICQKRVQDEWLFSYAQALFRNDPGFDLFLGGKLSTIDTYLNRLSGPLPFGQESRMFLHYLSKFQGVSVLRNIFFEYGISPLLSDDMRVKLTPLHQYNVAAVPLNHIQIFEKVMNNLSKFPVAYSPGEYYLYQGAGELLEAVSSDFDSYRAATFILT